MHHLRSRSRKGYFPKKIAFAIIQLDVTDNVVNSKDTEILGSVPEFDSMAIVTVLTMVEENYGIMIEDDEVSAEVFETLGSLVSFIEEKL